MGDTIVISNGLTNSAFLSGNPYILKFQSLFFPTDIFNYYLVYNAELDSMKYISEENISESFLTMLASEDVLKKYWGNPFEDEVWADL